MILKPLDIDYMISTPPGQIEYILPGLRAGRVGVVSAPGGTGKSFFLLEIACSVALGVTLFQSLPVKYARPVLFLTFEEDAIDLHARVHAIGESFSMVKKNAGELNEKLALYPCLGQRVSVCSPEGPDDGLRILEEAIEINQPGLVVLDPLAQLHSCDENSNPQMTRVMQILTNLAQKHQTGILIAHHTSKSSVLNGDSSQQSTRGASALIDSARWAATLQKATKDIEDRDWLVDLTFTKLNNHKPIRPIRLRREKTGVLVEDDIVFRGGKYA